MAKKTLQQCKSGNDFVAYAESHGGRVDHQTGSHAIVRGPNGGICPVPMHAHEIATGTRHSIIKLFAAIGLAAIAFIGLLAVWPIF